MIWIRRLAVSCLGLALVVLAGMSGNLCVEAHMRELIEDGFEVAVVGDATASAILPDLDGNQAAQTNFRMIASHVYTTAEFSNALSTAKAENK